VRVSTTIQYQDPRRRGAGGLLLLPDQTRLASEKKLLEARGFVIIEVALQKPPPTEFQS